MKVSVKSTGTYTGETDIKVHLIDCDCAFTWFLNEVTLEDGELVFNCTNGYD